MNGKKEIRSKILKIRKALCEDEVRELSRAICHRVCGTEEYTRAGSVCLYMPINNEVDVTYMMDAADRDGKRIWLPRVKDGRMEFCSYEKGKPLVAGAFGIPEPDSQKRLEADGNTLVIMPGAVFSEKRDRIGYGGGYYDVFLHDNPQCMTVAVCYDFQILTELPAEEHDIKPDVIVSSRRILR